MALMQGSIYWCHMKSRRIEVRRGQTVNLGNFESFRVDIGMSADITDKSDIAKEYEKMIDIVESRLIEELEGIEKTDG